VSNNDGDVQQGGAQLESLFCDAMIEGLIVHRLGKEYLSVTPKGQMHVCICVYK